jgi:protein BUR2
LGTKVEEHPRKLKEIVIACCRVAQKNPVLIVDEQTKDYWRWKDTITQNEDVMLEILCFDLTIESPYKVLYEIIKTQGVVHHKTLRDTAWSFLNDSGMTQLCLLFPTRTIACAALYCGAKKAGVEFEDDKRGRPWWERHSVSGRDLRRAYNHMATFFGDAPLKPGQENIYGGGLTPIDSDEQYTKTRLRREQVTKSPEPTRVRGSESPKKRSREEHNGNGGPVIPSRVPAAVRASADDRASKRQRTEELEDAPNTSLPINGQQTTPDLSEEGELEE